MFFYIMSYIILCLIVGLLGRDRAIGFLGCSVAALLFNPILVAIVLLLTIPKREKKPSY